jgi:hypothetical protein
MMHGQRNIKLNIAGSVSFLCYSSSSQQGVCLSSRTRKLHDFFVVEKEYFHRKL